MSNIDHAAKAERLVNPDGVMGDINAVWEKRIAAAQVHATLALVEQQRLANTIAAINEYGRDTLSWPPKIREALGLS